MLQQGDYAKLSETLKKHIDGSEDNNFKEDEKRLLELLKSLADLYHKKEACEAMEKAKPWKEVIGKMSVDTMSAIDVCTTPYPAPCCYEYMC